MPTLDLKLHAAQGRPMATQQCGLRAPCRRHAALGAAPIEGGRRLAAAQRWGVHAGPSEVFVLDFDGVICDSQREVSASGYEAASKYWPEVFGGRSPSERERIMAGLAAARPRLVKGFEAMVMARLIAEDASGAVVDRMLAGWPESMLDETLEAWGEAPDALAAAFEHQRATQMAVDFGAFAAHNALYPGVAAALADCASPYYFASSKSGKRLIPLLNHHFGLGLAADSPRVFHSLIPPNEQKIAALRSVMQRPAAADPACALHFVDDRFETLQAISEQPDLASRWSLWFADWGYNTEEEREAAPALPGVRLLALPQFCELLRWGVVMEVDDGCEPTSAEAVEGVTEGRRQ